MYGIIYTLLLVGAKNVLQKGFSPWHTITALGAANTVCRVQDTVRIEL